MRSFSGTQAVSAGFRLIRREPLAFLAWAATYFVVCFLPQIGMMSVVLPAWSRMMQALVAAGAHPDSFPPAAAFETQARMMQLQPLVLLASLLGHALVTGAVYRAVLFPQDRRFLYLRLSARELWLGLVMLVLVVLMTVLMAGLTLLIVTVGGLIALVSHAPAGLALMAPLAVVALLGVLCWVGLRLSFALPMSFSAPGFRLYESWAATRGQAMKMFFVVIAFVAMILVAELVILAGVFGAIGGVAGLARLSSRTAPLAFDLQAMAPWIVFAGLVSSVLTTALMTLFSGAWAEIYRDVMAPPDAV